MMRHTLPKRSLLLALGLATLAAAPAYAGSAPNRVQRITVTEGATKTTVDVVATRRPTFTVFKLGNPTRLFVDIVDADLSQVAPKMMVRNGVIDTITTSADVTGGRSVGRVVIRFDRDASYDVKTVGHTLRVEIDGAARDLPDLEAQAARAESKRLREAIERERKLLAQLQRARTSEEQLAAKAQRARTNEQELVKRVEQARRKAEALSKAAQRRADKLAKRLEGLKKARQLEAAKIEALARATRAEQARKAAVEAERKKAEALRRATARALAEQRAELAAKRAAVARAKAEEKAARREAKAAKARARAAERVARAERQGDARAAKRLRKELAARERELRAAQASLAAQRKAVEEARLAAAQAAARRKTAMEAKLKLERERRLAAEAALARERERTKALHEALAQRKKTEAVRASDEAARRSAEAQRQLAALEDQLRAQREAVAEAANKAELERARIALIANQLDNERAELAKLRAAKDQAKAELAHLRDAADQAKAAAAAAERRASEAEARSAQAERKAALARQRALAAARVVEAAKKSGASAKRLAAVERTAREARQAAEAAEREAAAMRAQLQAAEARAQREAAGRAEAQAQAATEARARAAAERKVAELKRRLTDTEKAAQASRPKVTPVRDVRFDAEAGKGILRVAMDGTPSYRVVRHGARRVELELPAATLPTRLERSLDTADLGSPVKLVSSFRSKDDPHMVRVVVDLRQEATADVRTEGNTVVWTFAGVGPGAGASAVAKAAVPRRGERVPPGVRGYPGAVGAEGGAVTPAGGGFSRMLQKRRRKKHKKYTGKKINLTIKDADIQHVLTFLAKEGGVNIVASDKVSGKVTFHLENIPWDLALDMILKTQGYDYVKEAGVYRVAPVDDIRQEFEAELKKKQTIRDLKPNVVRFITVNYADLDKLAEHVKTVLSKTGTVSVDQATSTMIVKDVEEHVQAAEDIVRRLDVQLPQVLIEARIVEASTTFSNEVGVQWGGNFTMAPAFGNPTGLAFPSIVGVSGGADDAAAPQTGILGTSPNFAVNLPAAVGAGAGGALGLTLGSLGGSANLNLRLSAAESRGSVKIISAPKILTLDGNKATIKQGVSIPVPVISANGVNTQFFNADLKLDVLTNSSPDGNIRLDIDITKNEPDFGQRSSNGAPSIQKKEAKTSLLVRDGETTVIGGIYTRNTGRNVTGVPVLSKIPILGWFFQNHSENDNRSELLIFITPRIANRRASVVGAASAGPGAIAP